MSDDYKIYDKVQASFQKLEPTSGDIIIIKFPEDIHPKQMEVFAENLYGIIPEQVTILCTRDGVEINKISEAEMNLNGWYRFSKDKTIQ